MLKDGTAFTVTLATTVLMLKQPAVLVPVTE